jgi:glutamate carboxypeptidase
MKANCILALEVLRSFDELKTSPKHPITILFTCDEEIGSHAGREIVEREARNSEFCLVLEPSSKGRAKTSRKGTALFSLRAHGLPAHAGLEPEKGASAILEVARQIEKLQSLNAPEMGTTVNVCQMKGGTASNVIPDFAECSIDVRFSKLEEAKKIEEAIRGLKPFDERVRLEIGGEINRPPLERTEKVAALYANANAISEKFGCTLGETLAGGASDGNFVGALGIPVLDGLGIKGDGAHTLEEFIYVDDIEFRAGLLFNLLLI